MDPLLAGEGGEADVDDEGPASSEARSYGAPPPPMLLPQGPDVLVPMDVLASRIRSSRSFSCFWASSPDWNLASRAETDPGDLSTGSGLRAVGGGRRTREAGQNKTEEKNTDDARS